MGPATKFLDGIDPKTFPSPERHPKPIAPSRPCQIGAPHRALCTISRAPKVRNSSAQDEILGACLIKSSGLKGRDHRNPRPATARIVPPSPPRPV